MESWQITRIILRKAKSQRSGAMETASPPTVCRSVWLGWLAGSFCGLLEHSNTWVGGGDIFRKP